LAGKGSGWSPGKEVADPRDHGAYLALLILTVLAMGCLIPEVKPCCDVLMIQSGVDLFTLQVSVEPIRLLGFAFVVVGVDLMLVAQLP
jgi:hypothetical protein